jgi:hypothetical protein
MMEEDKWALKEAPNGKVKVLGGRGPGRPKKIKRGPKPKIEKDTESEYKL